MRGVPGGETEDARKSGKAKGSAKTARAAKRRGKKNKPSGGAGKLRDMALQAGRQHRVMEELADRVLDGGRIDAWADQMEDRLVKHDEYAYHARRAQKKSRAHFNYAGAGFRFGALKGQAEKAQIRGTAGNALDGSLAGLAAMGSGLAFVALDVPKLRRLVKDRDILIAAEGKAMWRANLGLAVTAAVGHAGGFASGSLMVASKSAAAASAASGTVNALATASSVAGVVGAGLGIAVSAGSCAREVYRANKFRKQINRLGVFQDVKADLRKELGGDKDTETFARVLEAVLMDTDGLDPVDRALSALASARVRHIKDPKKRATKLQQERGKLEKDNDLIELLEDLRATGMAVAGEDPARLCVASDDLLDAEVLVKKNDKKQAIKSALKFFFSMVIVAIVAAVFLASLLVGGVPALALVLTSVGALGLVLGNEVWRYKFNKAHAKEAAMLEDIRVWANTTAMIEAVDTEVQAISGRGSEGKKAERAKRAAEHLADLKEALEERHEQVREQRHTLRRRIREALDAGDYDKRELLDLGSDDDGAMTTEALHNAILDIQAEGGTKSSEVARLLLLNTMLESLEGQLKTLQTIEDSSEEVSHASRELSSESSESSESDGED